MILGIDASQANREIRSGTEWYAFHLIQEFKGQLSGRKDIRVRLYVRGALQKDLAEGLPANFEIAILTWPLRYFWGQLRLSWEMLWHPPDVLFCPAHTIPLIHPERTLTTLHDIGFEDYPELYDWRSRTYHRWAARLAIENASHIFTVSEFSKNRIVEVYGYPPEKITVTYLGGGSKLRKLACDEAAPILHKYGLSGENYTLFVGRLEPKKNILGLLKGYERSGIEAALVLAGQAVRIGDVWAYLHKRPVLASRTKFLGYVSEGEKAALYSGAKIFLFPTLYEGFGLPIVEAQACGAPVLTSNTGSNPEIAGAGAVIVDPQSEYDLGLAIADLWKDDALRREKIEAGYTNIKRFAWPQTAAGTLAVLLR